MFLPLSETVSTLALVKDVGLKFTAIRLVIGHGDVDDVVVVEEEASYDERKL